MEILMKKFGRIVSVTVPSVHETTRILRLIISPDISQLTQYQAKTDLKRLTDVLIASERVCFLERIKSVKQSLKELEEFCVTNGIELIGIGPDVSLTKIIKENINDYRKWISTEIGAK